MAWAGFFSCNVLTMDIPKKYELLQYKKINENSYVLYDKQERFSDDFVCECADEGCTLVSGCILNKSELVVSNEIWHHFVRSDKFDFSQLRGPFTGFVCSKDHVEVFGNQTGDVAVFYTCYQGLLIVSDDFNLVFEICNKNNIPLTYNNEAALDILSYGWVIDGNTLCSEITRLIPGKKLMYDGNSVRIEWYHKFNNETKNISFEKSIDKLDVLFRRAVKRCYDKDLEYGYNMHLADMSGGFDSRMACWVAKDMGYQDITNVSYSKSGSPEYQYVLDVVKALGNDLIYRPLDDLLFFYDLEDIINKNWGGTYYIGITGGNRVLNTLSFEKFGLEHTGQLGDVIIGASYQYADDQIKPERICVSGLHVPPKYKMDLDNYEIFALYYRGFMGVLSTHFIRSSYTYAVSPFLDVDLIDYCLSLPMEYRLNHKLYKSWMMKKYPRALELPSTRTSQPDRISLRKKFSKHLSPDIKKRILNIYRSTKFGQPDKNSMNPFDYWYSSESKVREFADNYFNSCIGYFERDSDIRDCIIKSFNSKRYLDKACALTVLAGYKRYFVER